MSTAPPVVTFSGTVVADNIVIGSTTAAGAAKFTGSSGVTATTINIIGGNHTSEVSTATFERALSGTTVTLDDLIAIAKVIFSGDNAVSISPIIRGSATAGEGTLQVTGTGKTFTSTIGSTFSLLAITVDAGTTTFSNTVAATTINTNASTTFANAVTATTINNASTILFNRTGGDITVAGNIVDSGTSTIQVINSADTNISTVTFSGTVTTDTLTIGSSSKSGAALFSGASGVTVNTAMTITGGNTATSENSTATFNYALSGSGTVTLDDTTSGGTATIVFAGGNNVTIASAIAGASAGEGTISITGTVKTFTGEIGGTNGANNVGAITIASSQTGTFKNNVAATTITINTGGEMIIDSAGTPAAITVRGAINGGSSGVGSLTVQNSGGTTFTGIIGGTRIGVLSITQTTTFQAAVSATILSTTAAISNGTTLDISSTSSIGANINIKHTNLYRCCYINCKHDINYNEQ